MAYEKEYAKYTTLSKVLESEKLKNFISEMKVLHYDKSDFEKIDNYIFEKDVPHLLKEKRLKYIFAFDGSKALVNMQTGFPTAELGLIRTGHVLVDLDKMIKFQEENFQHPEDYNKIFSMSAVDAAIPGFNVCGKDLKDPQDFFRYVIFDVFSKTSNPFVHELVKVNEVSDKLKDYKPKKFLNTVKDLIKISGNFSAMHPCPLCRNKGYKFEVGTFFNFEDSYLKDKAVCNCAQDPKELYITDLLHFHEFFSAGGGNDGLFTQFMGLFEKIMFANLLDALIDTCKLNKDFFQQIAFVLDGPLALYNTNSWVAQAILKKIYKYQKLGIDLLILGVEKNGAFVEHLKHMDTNVKESGNLNNGFLFFLNDNYIKKYVKHSSSKAPYGQDQYFGKKLFYKNHRGDLFVINMSYISKEDQMNFLNSKNDLKYVKMQKRLRDVVWILEKFYSSRYKNALSFISLAHENVAISNTSISQKMVSEFVVDNLSY